VNLGRIGRGHRIYGIWYGDWGNFLLKGQSEGPKKTVQKELDFVLHTHLDFVLVRPLRRAHWAVAVLNQLAVPLLFLYMHFRPRFQKCGLPLCSSVLSVTMVFQVQCDLHASTVRQLKTDDNSMYLAAIIFVLGSNHFGS
jgi:hypothetical protein